MIAAGTIVTLSRAEWTARAENHGERARKHTGPARNRRDRGQAHPIMDFLFEYYPFGFSLLEKWQPRVGTAIEWTGENTPPPAPFSERFHVVEGGFLTPDPRGLSDKERRRLEWIVELLEATRDRAPNFGCHGLHEWAMVYRGQDVRHEKTLNLRLPQDEIDAVVESRPVCCSHFDAFRFFTPESKPFNHLQPTLETRRFLEQSACLHANMDLYKWAGKAMPWAGSELLLDCFELAVALRDLDMRASPYDLVPWGLPPVRIETPDGRREYEVEQKRLAAAAAPLRDQLIATIRRTLDESGGISISGLDGSRDMG